MKLPRLQEHGVLLLLVLAVSMLSLVPPAEAAPASITSRAQSSAASVQIINDSKTPICAVYIAALTDTGWGDNRLGGAEAIAPGTAKQFSVPPSTYDLMLRDCNDKPLLERHKLIIAGEYVLHLTEDLFEAERLFRDARAQYKQGDRNGALQTFTRALDLYRHVRDRAGEGTTLHNMGTVYEAQEQYVRALEHYQQALAIWRDIGDRADESTTLNNIGAVYERQGQYDQALTQYQQALAIAQAIDDRKGKGTILNNIGAVYRNLGEYDKALDYYQQALEIAREVDDRAGEGNRLHNMGAVYDDRGQYAKALELYQQALAIRRAINDRAGEGSTLNNIGVVYDDQGQYQQALDYYQQALAIRRAINDRAGEGTTLNNIGQVYKAQGQYDQALDYYQQALAIRRAINDRAGEGSTLNNIGAIYDDQGQYAKALELYQQALTIARALKMQALEGTTLNNIGLLYDHQGQYTKALEIHQQALAIKRAINDRAGEGTTLNNIGLLYDHQGQYDQALDYYQQALAIRRAINDRAGEGVTLHNIGQVCEAQGQYQQALDYYQQALAIRRAINDRAGEGGTLNNIGVVYDDQGQYAKALEIHQQALAIRRAINDRAGEGTTLHNMGAVYDHQGQYASALAYYQQALAITQALGIRAGEAATLNNIGQVYKAQGQYEQALSYYQQALTIARAIGARAGEGTTLHNMGVVYQHQGNLTQALDYYAQAMDVLEDVRVVAGSQQGRAGFIARYASLYTDAASLFRQQGQDDEAFRTSERGRARAFLDSLATGQVQLSDQGATDLLIQEQEAYTARQAAQDALARARASSPPDPKLIADLEQQLEDAQRRYVDALAKIESQGGQLATLVPARTTSVRTVAEVQQLLDPQTTMVSFFVGEEQTLAFVISRESFHTVALSVGHAGLRDQVHALLDNPTFQQQAHTTEGLALYTTLIAPLKPYLTTPHLAIIPHGPLHYLPFAALSDGTRSLIDDYVVTTLPSASVLPFIQANSGRPFAPPLVLGNPDGTLRFAEQEARAVASLYGIQPLIGPQAAKDVLQKRVGEAGIVHLATHAVFYPNVPLASSITLAPTVTSTVRLEASEVYSLDLHKADLVTLSACQTNLGDVSAGDEVVGLTRAFFFAGTPTVISSLWSVDDEATGLLMERFYTHLRAGMGKAEALRQAQMDVRAQYPAPYYWSGFVLAGDAGAIPSSLLWWWIGGGLALVALIALGVVLLVRRRRRGQVASQATLRDGKDSIQTGHVVSFDTI